ncbi:MAG: 50S ribosomal protein L3 [Opitutales bacterium]|nr:50S ribosomal protein L3 [Opitutales bacterium]
MKPTIIGKKVGMTQVYDENNVLIPVTVIEAGPCPVVQIKTTEKDGYEAVQLGFDVRKEKNTSKAQLTRFKAAGTAPLGVLKEVRGEAGEVNVGDVLTVAQFAETKKVDIIGTTKGRGFQGVVKRWGFAGGPASHGSMFHRRGGSYGMCQWPGEVLKGKKMPGHMGSTRRTTQNLKVVKVIEEQNLILVKGSVHGPNGSTVVVRSAIKAKPSA